MKTWIVVMRVYDIHLQQQTTVQQCHVVYFKHLHVFVFKKVCFGRSPAAPVAVSAAASALEP